MKDGNKCEYGNCPSYPYDQGGIGWGLSPEGWAEAKRNHEENH